MHFSGIDRAGAAHLRGALIAGAGVDKDALRRDCLRLHTERRRRRDRWRHGIASTAAAPRRMHRDTCARITLATFDCWSRVVSRLAAGSIPASHGLRWNDDCIVQCERDAKQ